MSPTKRKAGGRPSKYSEALAEKLCELIREGLSERAISKMPGMPSTTTMRSWKDAHPEFLSLSARAREEAAEKFNDEALELREQLRAELEERMKTGEDFPKGAVDAYRLLFQEAARQSAMRDDSRFGDRKKVDVTTTRPVQITFINDLED